MNPSFRALYYYVRDEQKKPIVTVCLIAEDKKIVSRGIAICSDRDIPCKVRGKGIAYGRALKAYTDQKTNDEINRREAYVGFQTTDFSSICYEWPDYKSEFMPELNMLEQNLISKFK